MGFAEKVCWWGVGFDGELSVRQKLTPRSERVWVVGGASHLCLKHLYLGSAEKVCWWGQGVGCGVWGVGFYRF